MYNLYQVFLAAKREALGGNIWVSVSKENLTPCNALTSLFMFIPLVH